jgi:hypothetical protein
MFYDINEIKCSFPNIQRELESDGIIHLKEWKGYLGDGHEIRLL